MAEAEIRGMLEEQRQRLAAQEATIAQLIQELNDSKARTQKLESDFKEELDKVKHGRRT